MTPAHEFPGTAEPVEALSPYYLTEWQRPAELADAHDRSQADQAVVHGFEQGPSYRQTEFARMVDDFSQPETIELFQQKPGALVAAMNYLAAMTNTVDLGHLRYGLFGYTQVTLACSQHILNGPAGTDGRLGRIPAFDDPAKIQATMPVFFGELLRALRHHIDGNQAATGGWHEQFYSPRARNAPPAVAMMDFLAVHVRYDLAPALLRTGTDRQRHYDDYTVKINELLAMVAVNMVEKYAEFGRLSKTVGADKGGLWLALQELFAARDEAFGTFEAMLQVNDSGEYAAVRDRQRRRTEARLMSRRPFASLAFRWLTAEPTHGWQDAAALTTEVPRHLFAAPQALGYLATGQTAKPA